MTPHLYKTVTYTSGPELYNLSQLYTESSVDAVSSLKVRQDNILSPVIFVSLVHLTLTFIRSYSIDIFLDSSKGMTNKKVEWIFFILVIQYDI